LCWSAAQVKEDQILEQQLNKYGLQQNQSKCTENEKKSMILSLAGSPAPKIFFYNAFLQRVFG
jgi:hypothetical protein